MAYTPTFTPEYEDGWENLPSEDTPITADALNGYDGAIENIETYLSNNDIVSIEANPAEASTDSLTKIEIDGTVYGITGGGGSSTFAGLSDVDFDNLQNGQVPVYNSTSQKWENGSGGGGGNTNMWTGTQAQYTAQASSIADGTLVNITDDETHVQAYDIYSTSEQVCGQWIDGSTLYRKTINFGALPNNSTKDVAHGISNLGYVVGYKGTAYNPSNYYFLTLPYINASTTTGAIEVYFDLTNVSVVTKVDRTGYSVCYITIEYTKASS